MAHNQTSIYLIENVGGGVVDMLFFVDEQPVNTWFDLHVGQDDRLTFFGDPQKTIYASFIDCRKESPTLHRRIDISFNPDPTKHLHIERGIAYRTYNKKHVTVRVENLWYISDTNPNYDLSNDNISFRGDDDPKHFPAVEVNTHPAPAEVLQFVLSQQQKALLAGKARPISSRAVLNSDMKRVTVVPK